MSKSDSENPADAQETTAELQHGVNNTKERKMNQTDLLKINVNEHTEKKNGLTYLSWAWAWAEVLKVDPAATFKVETYTNAEGMVVPYMNLGNSSMVWVTVTIFGKAMTCQLPILDFRNKPIPSPNAFDVNTSIMRCLAKGIAMHGLGLYIYAGEDLPETDAEAPAEQPRKAVEASKKVEATRPPRKNEIVDWDNSDASRALFADGMIEFTATCNSVSDLSSYWSQNHLQLDSLKRTHPALYERVLSKFSELKKTFQG